MISIKIGIKIIMLSTIFKVIEWIIRFKLKIINKNSKNNKFITLFIFQAKIYWKLIRKNN